MADLKQVEAAFLKADAAGDTDAARVLAGEVRRLRAASGPAAQQPNPKETSAGGGQWMKDLVGGAVRGAGSIGATLLTPLDAAARGLGIENDFIGRRDRREAMDGGLREMGVDTDSLTFKGAKLGTEIAGTAGAGGVLATAARAVPAIASRAPALIQAIESGGIGKQAGNVLTRIAGGAITGGAGAGMVNPEDAAGGAAVGGAIPGAAALVRAAGKAVTPLLDAFGRPTAAGRQGAAVRAIEGAGVTPQMAAGVGPAVTRTGASPMLAERLAVPSNDPAVVARVAQMQDQLRAVSPHHASEVTSREVGNNAARVNTLRDMAGEGGARDFAAANRSGTSGPMYDEAFAVDASGKTLTPAQNRTMVQLMRAPAIQDAAREARRTAANSGKNVGPSNASGSVQGLHDTKLAMDDAIGKAQSAESAAERNKLRGLQDAQKRLVAFIESISPEYANARGVHAQMSVPLNQMDIAGQVLKGGSAATTDLGGVPRLMPDAMARQLKDEPALMKAATGRDLGGSLDDVLTPQQSGTVREISNELSRAAAIGRAGNGPGSATAKRLMQSQFGMLRNTNEGNAIIRTLGAGGALASGLATGGQGAAIGLPMLAVREVAGHLTRKTQDELGRLLLNPAELNALMNAPPKALTPAQVAMRDLAKAALRSMPVAATSTTGAEQ